MKTKRFKTAGKLSNTFYLSVLIILVFSMGLTAMVYAATAKEIDAGADAALVGGKKALNDQINLERMDLQ